MTHFLASIQLKLFYSYFYFLDILTLLLFLGVIGKSAQIFLESWLASAMEGPTPVSSLLHASTMIVSGAFLLQRFQSYIFCSINGILIITFVGALTAFFAGTIGLVAMDIKRIIAYSTCSQMGYLVFCVGLGNSNVSFFHLFNHAFFKCLLFVAAGTIIHALLNEQDIRKMGGLFKLFPFIFLLIFFASLSLMGIPFLSGFYSKEKILEYAFYIYNYSNLFAFWLGSFSALLTSLYSIRLIYIVFFCLPNNFKNYYQKIHVDVKYYLNFVLVLLGLGTLFSGYIFEDLIIGAGTDWLLYTSIKLNLYTLNLHLGTVYLTLLTFFYTCFGFFSYLFYNFFYKSEINLWFFYLFFRKNKYVKMNFFKVFYIFFGKRWYINLIYNRYFASVSFFLGYYETFVLLDKGFFEGISLINVRNIYKISSFLSFNLYRNFYFGEILFVLFILYSSIFFLFDFFFCFEFLIEKSYLIWFSIFFRYTLIFNFFFLACPRKRNRGKSLFKRFFKKSLNKRKKFYYFYLIKKKNEC